MSNVVEPVKGRVAQLDLFEQVQPDNGQFTNSIALYDIMPKYVWQSEQARREGGTLPVIKRAFIHDGDEYHLEIKPARLTFDDGSEIEYYPAEREQIIEEALRKIAIDKRRTRLIDKQVGVYFTIYELDAELRRIGHGMPKKAIREALYVCNACTIQVKARKNGKTMVSAPIFPVMALRSRNDEGFVDDTESMITFNPLVSAAIMSLDFRQLNYETNVRLKSVVSRWLHKRLSHRYHWARTDGEPFRIKGSTVVRDSGMGAYQRQRDAFRAISKALEELEEARVVASWIGHQVLGANRRIEDIDFEIHPSPEFAREMRMANHARGLVSERARILKLPVRHSRAEGDKPSTSAADGT